MNFKDEVRAQRDLRSFLNQASILLDEKATTLDEVLRGMLGRIVQDGLKDFDVEEVMNSLFTDAGGKECNGEKNTTLSEPLWDNLLRPHVHATVKKLFGLRTAIFHTHSSPSDWNHPGCDFHFHRNPLSAVLALYPVSLSVIVLKWNNAILTNSCSQQPSCVHVVLIP